MKLLKHIFVSFQMLFTHYTFYASAIFTTVLCLCGVIYHDSLSNESYSAVKALMEFDREAMLQNSAFCSIQIIANITGSWLSMFVPVIAAFAFIPIVCEERDSRAVRNAVFRSSRSGFYASRFAVTCLSGGLAVLLGFFLFAGFVCLAFPAMNQYSPEMQEQISISLGYSETGFSNPDFFWLAGRRFLPIFLYGCVFASPAALLTSIMKNKYLILCIPVFVKYACTQTCEKLLSQAIGDNFDIHRIQLIRILSPDSISNAFQMGHAPYILLYHFGLVTVFFVLYMLISNRRLDCGE